MVGQAENTGFEPLPQPDRYVGKRLPYPLSPSPAFSLTQRLSVLFLPLSHPTLPLPQNTKLPASQRGLPQPSHPLSFSYQTALPLLSGHFHILDGTLVAIPLCSKRSDKDALTWGLREQEHMGAHGGSERIPAGGGSYSELQNGPKRITP